MFSTVFPAFTLKLPIQTWRLHAQFSGEPHNFSKTSTPREECINLPPSKQKILYFLRTKHNTFILGLYYSCIHLIRSVLHFTYMYEIFLTELNGIHLLCGNPNTHCYLGYLNQSFCCIYATNGRNGTNVPCQLMRTNFV